jgi:lambda family phage portal protein
MSENLPWGVWDVIAADLTQKTTRHWEGAQTDRLNAAHWENASDNPIGDLRTDLTELQRRVRHESINNPILDAAIETQQTNVVSARGPALQVLTDDNQFNDAVEALFQQWATGCEYSDGLELVDLLDGWVAQYMIYGEIFAREIIGNSVSTYQIMDLGPESIDSTALAKNVHSGVEVDDSGRVIGYRIYDPANPASKDRLPATLALHYYRRRFAHQRRGFPAFASVLQPAADLRDYDDSVQDAARAAADHGVFFYSDHPDAEFVEPETTTLPWKRRVRQYIRPGWKIAQLDSRQPSATYREFRKEKQTDIGNVLEMPWMILRKDASNHNMSSARFDGSRYAKSVERLQAKIERRFLTPIVRRLVRIAQYTGVLGPTPAQGKWERLAFEFPNIVLPISWTWPKPPAVDNLKDATAERVRLENGTLALSEAIAESGRRPEETLRIRARDNAALVAAGLPPILGAVPASQSPADLLNTIAAMDAAESNPTADGINTGEPSPETPPIDTATELDD